MNRYFTKRKPKKAPTAQPKFDLDLTTALPAQDDFRTSLIMNSLSARFSMLREQDDPTSLLGKASDDSVLGPRRQSRLMDFGYSPGRALHDIAEVSSIRSSIRPPFAASSRADSYFSESGYGTDDENGSIMNRSRPGEGNSLFGGRQKIYKIPIAGATSEASIGSAGSMKGRVLYDDDVSMSTFQRWRKEERERLGNDKDRAISFADDDSPSKADRRSPLGGTVTRHASTSTNAASTGRTSTAATSITSHQGAMSASNTLSMVTATSPSSSLASPPLDRNTSKSRRLYDTTLTREIEEQQSTNLARLGSIQNGKSRGGSPTFGRSSSRQGYAANQIAEPSQPSLSANNPYGLPVFPLTETTIPENDVSESQPPSPPRKYSHDPLQLSINPRDRGKATAMGAFNKPQQFSEQQYLERQLTLRGAAARQPYNRNDEAPKPESRAMSINEDRSASPSVYAHSTYSGRSRAPTNASAQEMNFSAFSVFQSAAHQIKSATTVSSEQASIHDVDHGFDFGLESVKSTEPASFTNTSCIIPPLNIAGHPAMRNGAQSRPTTSKSNTEFPRLDNFQQPLPNEQFSRNIASGVFTSSKYEEPLQSLDSLAPANGGLSGLVRQHLRQDSAASSQFDFDDHMSSSRYPTHLTLATKNVNGGHKNDLVTPADSDYSHISNPFDLEDLKQSSQDTSHYSSDPSTGQSKQEDDVSPKAVRSTRRRGMSQAPDTISDVPWAQRLQKSHTREASNETIQEQDALANELARRKAEIQERLKAKMEVEPPMPIPVSPTPEEKPIGGTFRGLEILRTKSSRESIKKLTDSVGSSKTSKLFGIPTSITPTSERPSFQSDRFRSEDASSTYAPSIRSRSTSRPATSRSVAVQPIPKPYASSGIDSARTSGDFARDRKGSNPPPIAAQNATARSRSNSVQSNGRSRSRTGRYKDDLERAMIEGSSRVTTQIWPDAPVLPDALPPMPSLENTQRFTTDGASAHPNLKIAVNRPSMPASGYFESKGLYPLPQPISSPMSLSSTASSPMLPHHNLSPRQSPGLSQMSSMSAKPSPGLYHNMATPPLSGASTPINHAFAQQSHAAPPSSYRSRSLSTKKRSISKYEISEPRLISTTSVIDTVALPAGASLRNGMHHIQKAAPPLPAINPLRQKAGLSGQSMQESVAFKPRHRLRKSSSEGAKLGMHLRAQSPAISSNPALASYAPRPPMDGGMF